MKLNVHGVFRFFFAMVGRGRNSIKMANLVVEGLKAPRRASPVPADERWSHTSAMWLAVLLAAVVHANVHPMPRQLGAFYFNSPDESQIWVDLDPQPTGGGEAPVRLNFTIKFRGRELDTTPAHATIRVTSNSFVAPTHIRLPVLTLHLADDTVIDLTGPGSVYSFTASCHTCPSDTLVTDIPFTVLEQMTASSVIVVNTLGFDGKLVSEDVAAMRRLVAAVKDGATVKP